MQTAKPATFAGGAPCNEPSRGRTPTCLGFEVPSEAGADGAEPQLRAVAQGDRHADGHFWRCWKPCSGLLRWRQRFLRGDVAA
jgi:hypothetical protein